MRSLTPHTQVLPAELLANTKKLRCAELTPQINSAVGIRTLHISLSKSVTLPHFQGLLENLPELKELHLAMKAFLRMSDDDNIPREDYSPYVTYVDCRDKGGPSSGPGSPRG